ncbi:MAG: hypothetical protein DMF76_02865 [Acidobacteria bacterium]|nr:MAG: hypothetical protein DMF76_02865 [Acidobacteriota bacterium]
MTRNPSLTDQERLSEPLWGLVEVPNYVTSVKAAVSIWTFVAVALTALLLFVVVGGFYRTRRTATNPA